MLDFETEEETKQEYVEVKELNKFIKGILDVQESILGGTILIQVSVIVLFLMNFFILLKVYS